MKVTILGTGTSQGVPVIACSCEVCQSADSSDKRLRVSAFVEVDGVNIVIDTGPDFRQQMLAANVQTLDAVLFTHEHKDHTAGLDDVRAFNFKQKKDMEVFADARVQAALKMEFSYIFAENKYPGIPMVHLNEISKESTFTVNGVKITPIESLHHKLPVLGFRIKDFTYITDAKTISSEEKRKLKGTKVLILNALRREEHISHLNLEQALELIEEIQPEQAYLTHISHLFGKHHDIEKELPDGVNVAYDGLNFKL